MPKLSGKALAEWEKNRDLNAENAELEQSLIDIQMGNVRRYTQEQWKQERRESSKAAKTRFKPAAPIPETLKAIGGSA